MEKKKFRNHFSIVIEKLGVMLVTILVILVTEGIEVIEDIISDGVESSEILIVSGAILLILLLILTYQIIIWSKTWIMIEDDIITMEKKTIMNKRNSIGLKNVSNVNTEQNLFEMLIGTCKVKLDTNSLSTANATDVKIVLNKNEAEQLRKILLQRVKELNSGEKQQQEVFDEVKEYDVESSFLDIFMNGVYSITVLSVIVFLTSGAAVVDAIRNGIQEGFASKTIFSGLAGIVVMLFLVFSSLSSILKGFMEMYGFRATREDDRIYLNYGLFKKVNYMIPVGKINGLCIKQTMIARIFHRYSAELINIGMGDDEKKTVSFIFYTKKEKLEEVVGELLPEFSETLDWNMDKQPRSVWLLKGISLVFFAAVIGLAAYEWNLRVSDLHILKYCNMGAIGVSAFVLLISIMGYITDGIQVKEKFVGIVRGCFGRQFVFLKYSKIQYVQINQNFITRRLGICQGMLTLLASQFYKVQKLPYMKEEKINQISKGLFKRKGKIICREN